jgi:hypothetical protein
MRALAELAHLPGVLVATDDHPTTIDHLAIEELRVTDLSHSLRGQCYLLWRSADVMDSRPPM